MKYQVSFRVKTWYLHMWKYHCCYGYMINCTFHITWSLGDTKFLFSCWKKYFTCSLCSLVKCFSTLKEKFRISVRPCNILYVGNDNWVSTQAWHMHTLIASLRAADNSLITYLVRVFFSQNLSGCSCQALKLLLFKLSWSPGLLSQGKQACLCSCIKDILQLEFTDICNIDLQIKTPHPWVRFTCNHIVTTVKPPLTLTSLQQPLLFVPVDKNPYIDSC